MAEANAKPRRDYSMFDAELSGAVLNLVAASPAAALDEALPRYLCGERCAHHPSPPPCR